MNSILDHFSKNVNIIILAFLIVGILLTCYGFVGLIAEPQGWRWATNYAQLFLALTFFVAIIGVWRGVTIGIIIVSSLVAILLGAVFPILVVVVLSLSAYALGKIIIRYPNIAATDYLLVGIVAFGTIFSLLVQLPINNIGSWGIIIAIPLIFGHHDIQEITKCILRYKYVSKSETIMSHLLYSSITGAGLVHLIAGLMPEIGHDALASHLFIPAFVANNQFWGFDASIYSWAVMPMLVDWIYSVGFMFGGETVTKLVNVGSIFLLCILLVRVTRWAGANKVGSAWAVLLFLLNPVTFLESSSLFIEGFWSTLVIAGTLALLRTLNSKEKSSIEVYLAAILFGGAISAKAVTAVLLPLLVIVMIIRWRHWYSKDLIKPILVGSLVFFVVGGVPYIRALILTGNPVFPFFNAFFGSEYFPFENFTNGLFNSRLTWDTMYQMTFNTNDYLEATPGGAGFHWMMLFVPATAWLLITRHKRGILLSVIAIGWIFFVFEQQSYLRYVFPSIALTCVIIGIFVSSHKAINPIVHRFLLLTAGLTLLANLLHLNAGTWQGHINLDVITDKQKKETYLRSERPIRVAVQVVNKLNSEQRPVPFFSQPFGAGLAADALYPNWYNGNFHALVFSAKDSTALSTALSSQNVEYMLVDSNWNYPNVLNMLNDISDEVSQIGTISIRKLSLKNPRITN